MSLISLISQVNCCCSSYCVLAICFFAFSTPHAAAQLTFTQEERLVFIGVDNQDDKRTIISLTITPRDSFTLDLSIEILENFIPKASFIESVKLDKQSLRDNFASLVFNTDSLPAYLFSNEQDAVLLVAKEVFFERANNDLRPNTKNYHLSIAQLVLPGTHPAYISGQPFLHYK